MTKLAFLKENLSTENIDVLSGSASLAVIGGKGGKKSNKKSKKKSSKGNYPVTPSGNNNSVATIVNVTNIIYNGNSGNGYGCGCGW
jgi:hypothetical protein